jgi:hypothetical protein
MKGGFLDATRPPQLVLVWKMLMHFLFRPFFPLPSPGPGPGQALERDHALVDGGREGGSPASPRPRSLPVNFVPCSSPHPSLIPLLPWHPSPTPLVSPPRPPPSSLLFLSPSTRPPPDAPQPLPRTAPSSPSRL